MSSNEKFPYGKKNVEATEGDNNNNWIRQMNILKDNYGTKMIFSSQKYNYGGAISCTMHHKPIVYDEARMTDITLPG